MTSNPQRGDVSFDLSGKTYTLRYSHLALAKLEADQDKSLFQIMTELSTPGSIRINTVISLLWAGLQKHHPGMTKEDVAELLDEMDGGAPAMMIHVNEAFAKAFASTLGTKGTNPTQREVNGAGMKSLSSMSVSDLSQPPFGTSLRES